jgi:hypothetical protein
MWFIVAVVVLVVVAVAAWAYVKREQRLKLQSHFGPEYDRAVREAGGRAKAESMLMDRAKRVRTLDIHPLSREQAEAFRHEWEHIQQMFVDDPNGAVAAADDLVSRVMNARNYPVADFDKRADDLSVQHPHVVENYRTARVLMTRRERGEASTEELRQAVVNYRALFDDLLKTEEGAFRRAS